MKVTVTGAAGMLGSHVLDLLWENGYEVRATDQNYRRDLPVRVEVATLLDREACYAMLEGSDALVHLGNHANLHGKDGQRIFNENVMMNMNVFEAAAEVGVKRIVFASSIQAIGRSLCPGNGNATPQVPSFPLGGATPSRPDNLYALSKQTGEITLRYFSDRFPIVATAVRFPFLMNARIRERFREANSCGAPWRSPADAFSWLDARDAAALIDLLLRGDLSGYRIFMPSAPVATGESVAELTAKHFPGVPWATSADDAESFFDVAEIAGAIGWKPAIVDPLEG